mmetsp:Transcript_113176/g.205855  ORF Transcript_113176/g.205855 Transcript_113176/m.205855 type:complete len:407 (+) Transcript_113176:99-1319(+)
MQMSLILASLTMLQSWLLVQSSTTQPSKDSSFIIGDKTVDHIWYKKESMPQHRSDMTATTVEDEIYLIGGCALDQEWVHDPPYSEYRCGGGKANAVTGSTLRYFPKTNRFDTPLQDAPRARYRHAAAVVGKKIYLFGGTGSSGSIVAEIDVFDVGSGLWSTLSEKMPNPTTDLGAFAYAGKIYTVGGYDVSWKALNVTQVFDPSATNSESAWQIGPALLQGRGDSYACVVGMQAYVVGGFHHENNFAAPIATLEMLDLSSSGSLSWVSKPGMSVSRGDKAVASLNGLLHVVGGEAKNNQGHSVALRDVEVYDPVSNAWYFGGDIPSDRFRFTAASHGNSIFIFGGQGYLVGQHGADASHYPLMGVVEEYSETIAASSVSKTVCGIKFITRLMFACWMLAALPIVSI